MNLRMRIVPGDHVMSCDLWWCSGKSLMSIGTVKSALFLLGGSHLRLSDCDILLLS